MSLSRTQVLRATTTSPWTNDFRHLLPIPRRWTKRVTFKNPYIKVVAPQQRIKYWNIVPGDRIRVRGEPEGTIHEVLSINRLSNRVFLKGVVSQGEERKSGKSPTNKNVHYSRCQLFIGNYEFPPGIDASEPAMTPVFAQRLGRVGLFWQPMGRRWEWDRVVEKTTPTLPEGVSGERIVVPWPKPEKNTPPEPTSYDTQQEAVLEVTYKPPFLPVSTDAAIPKPPKESTYVNSLFNPTPIPIDGPVEIYLHKELSNPHSRAKKQARWQAHKLRSQAMLTEFVKEELKDLKGRTVREARAEAVWKCRQKLEEDKKAEKKRRTHTRATEARFIRKKERKERKERRQRQKLTEMVLRDEPNQVVPK